jgi:hypothetical protein
MKNSEAWLVDLRTISEVTSPIWMKSISPRGVLDAFLGALLGSR